MTYLSRACLWKVRNDDDLLGCCKRSDDLADLENKFLRERSFVVLVICELAIAAVMVNVRLDRKIPTTHGLRVTKAKTACPVTSSAVPITG